MPTKIFRLFSAFSAVVMMAAVVLMIVAPVHSGTAPQATPTPTPEATMYRLNFYINRLTCLNAQEDRPWGIDGRGDEAYLVYTLREIKADGSQGNIAVQTWGIERMERDEVISGQAFRILRLDVEQTSTVYLEVLLYDSDNYEDAEALLDELQQHADSEYGLRLKAPSITGDTTSYADLFDEVTGIEFFGFIAGEDELGRLEIGFSPTDLASLEQNQTSYLRNITFEEDNFNNTYEYTLKTALLVQNLSTLETDVSMQY